VARRHAVNDGGSRRPSSDASIAGDTPKMPIGSEGGRRRRTRRSSGGSRPRDGRVTTSGGGAARQQSPSLARNDVYYPRRDYPWATAATASATYYDPCAWGTTRLLRELRLQVSGRRVFATVGIRLRRMLGYGYGATPRADSTQGETARAEV
jgi:hypothetical protein